MSAPVVGGVLTLLVFLLGVIVLGALDENLELRDFALAFLCWAALIALAWGVS